MGRHRREMRLNGRRDAPGFWMFTKYRVRSVADYVRIVQFPRCPPLAKSIAQGRIDRLLAEARRYTEDARWA